MVLGLVRCQDAIAALPQDPRAHFRLEASAASAFRTSDCEIPNCRAIRDGVIPALKAARTAFNFALVNGSGLLQSAASAGFRPEREVFCRVAAARPRPQRPIGQALRP